MRIGKRLFPYPVLNHEKLYSQYKNGIFSLQYSEIMKDTSYVLEGLSFETNSEWIRSLIQAGKAKAVCVVECPQTMYRKSFDISETPRDIEISLWYLSGKVSISAFVIALDDIPNFSSNEFLEDYDDYKFIIEKNDIIAADDGFNTVIEFDSEEENKKSSIFLIIKDKTIKNETMETDIDSGKIIIRLPEREWDFYDKTKRTTKFENLYFATIAIPALTYALGVLQKNSDSVDQLCLDYSWFNSFKKQYENVNKKQLTDEEFMKMNPCVESQRLLNTPTTKAISDIFDLLVMPNLGGNEDD